MDVQALLRSILGSAKSKVSAPSEVMAEPPDTLVAVQYIFTFHRSTYRTLLKTALGQSIIISLLLLISIGIVLTAAPQDRFFVASVDGRIDRVMPLDAPLRDNNQMFSLTALMVDEAMTFGFLDYDQRKIEVGSFFADNMLDKIQGALMGSGGISRLRTQATYYQAELDVTRGGGVIKQHINPQHIYEWVISIPVRIITKAGYESTKSTATPWTVTVLVQRSTSVERRNSIVIADILAAQAVGAPQPYVETGDQAK